LPGTTIAALTLSSAAAYATANPWLPLEGATTPLEFAAAGPSVSSRALIAL
jgi:hypothetical protein